MKQKELINTDKIIHLTAKDAKELYAKSAKKIRIISTQMTQIERIISDKNYT